MKNRVIFYMVCTCISLSSCLDKNNLNLSDRDKEEELDLSFDFGMISEKKLEVTTRSNSGSAIIIRKSKFPQNPKRSVRFSGKRTKRSVQKRKARNTQKAETKVL